MREIAVIGLNNYGMEMAKELSQEGASVVVIDNDKSRIDKIAPMVRDTILIKDWQLSSMESISFDQYSTVILALSGKMDLVLGALIYLKSIEPDNVIVCVENKDEAMISDLFKSSKGWKQVRIDQIVAGELKKLVNQI